MRSRPFTLGLTLIGALALLGAPVSAQSYSPRQPESQIDVGIFYDSLAPYGEWVEMPDYGWSWAPRVERGWRPYTRGQWVLTDDGWFWDSDEHFGWAAYHYGRWVNDRYYGWVWVPGTDWAPAWVSWRHGNGYTGWAPLPPRATWQVQAGFTFGDLDIDAFIGARDYTFVQDRTFVDRGIYQRVLPPTQNVTIINVTTNVTNYTYVNQRVVNRGVDVANVERALGRHVSRARAVDVDRADAPRRARADEVAVFRPEVRAAPGRRPTQGRSLVKGEEPPQLLVERRRQREQEQPQKGNEPEVTAKDVERRRAAGPRNQQPNTAEQQPSTGANTRPPQYSAQQQRDQARQDAAKQQTQNQEQQRLDNAKRQANAQQQRDQARQDAAKQQAQNQEQQRLDNNAKRQGKGQQQGDPPQSAQQRAKREANAKEAEQQAKKDPKDKGKKKPKASEPPPPPAAEQP